MQDTLPEEDRDSEIKARNSKRKGHRTDEASKRKPRPRNLQRELELMLDEKLASEAKEASANTMDKLKHEFEAELRKKDELHERKMDELTAKHKLQLKAQPLCMAISQGKKDTQPIINSHAAEIRALNKKHLQDKQAMEAKHLDEICMERSRVKLAEERARVASECVNSSSSGAGQQCNDPNVKALMERHAKEKLEIHEQCAQKFREERERHAIADAKLRQSCWTDARDTMYHEGFRDGLKRGAAGGEPARQSPIVLGRKRKGTTGNRT